MIFIQNENLYINSANNLLDQTIDELNILKDKANITSQSILIEADRNYNTTTNVMIYILNLLELQIFKWEEE